MGIFDIFKRRKNIERAQTKTKLAPVRMSVAAPPTKRDEGDPLINPVAMMIYMNTLADARAETAAPASPACVDNNIHHSSGLEMNTFNDSSSCDVSGSSNMSSD